MDEAELRYADSLREEAHLRAMGERGRIRSDEILKALLKAKVPEFKEKAQTSVHVAFVQLIVEKLQAIVQKVVPITCDHCGKALDTRKNLALEFGHLDAIEVTTSENGE